MLFDMLAKRMSELKDNVGSPDPDVLQRCMYWGISLMEHLVIKRIAFQKI